jgi:hypothetical protein
MTLLDNSKKLDSHRMRTADNVGIVKNTSASFTTTENKKVWFKARKITGRKLAYIPTIEELIGACGAEFDSLQRWGSFNKFTTTNKLWCAWANQRQTYAGGDTPEEALANLWLALNSPQ